MSKIIILGAGLTGLSAAYHLEKKGFFNYKIFEKENEFGGLCRTIKQDGFTFDYTGHLLHINDNYFESLIEIILNKDDLNSVIRRAFIYSNQIYTHYPFQMNLYGLPTNVIIECIEGFLTKPKKNKIPKSFDQWVNYNFGLGFAKNFFSPFQNKIFDYDIKKISASWTGRFVPATNLKQILEGAVKEPNQSNIGYNSQFYYPKEDGIYFWVKKFAAQIKNTINTNFCVQTIDLKNKVILFTNGHAETFEKIITTIPLDNLLQMLKEKSNTNLKKNYKNLICNSVINFNLGIAKKNISDKHWIYFPETQYPFYRMGFPHNFSEKAVPKDHSSLYGEFSYINKDQKQINEILKESIKQVKKLLNFEDKDIVTQKIINIKNAYVIFNFWRERNLPNLLLKLKEESVFSIGRYGQWKYSSMQEAILDGKKASEDILLEMKTIIPAKKFDEFKDQKVDIKQKEIQNG